MTDDTGYLSIICNNIEYKKKNAFRLPYKVDKMIRSYYYGEELIDWFGE